MKKILIIDNSIVIRSVIRNLFVDNQRLIVFEANSKEETEKLIKEHDFFVVISNLFLIPLFCFRFTVTVTLLFITVYRPVNEYASGELVAVT